MAACTVASALLSEASAGCAEPLEPELHDARTNGTSAHHEHRSNRWPGRRTVKM